jgi:abortive infection bacteriophage resistance protein
MLNKDMQKNEKYKSLIEKLLPESKPNSELKMIGLPSATLVQNAM